MRLMKSNPPAKKRQKMHGFIAKPSRATYSKNRVAVEALMNGQAKWIMVGNETDDDAKKARVALLAMGSAMGYPLTSYRTEKGQIVAVPRQTPVQQ